jgi:hypothetical protein
MKIRAKTLLSTLITLSVLAAPITKIFAQQNAEQPPAIGTEGGKGGGGLLVNGVPVTFGTAGFEFPTQPDLQAEEISGLNEVVKSLRDKPFFLSNEVRNKLLRGIMPTPSRRYQNVNSTLISTSVLNRIFEEYRRTTKKDISELSLYALTDTYGKVTYLFPEYYKLNLIEKQSILFHEAVWLEIPGMSYQTVITAEIGYQNYLESLSRQAQLSSKTIYDLVNPKKIYDLVNVFSDPLSMLKFVVEIDLKRGVINQHLKNDLLPYRFLYGEETISCLKSMRLDCNDELYNNLRYITMQNPDSLLLRYISDSITNGRAKLLSMSKGSGHFAATDDDVVYKRSYPDVKSDIYSISNLLKFEVSRNLYNKSSLGERMHYDSFMNSFLSGFQDYIVGHKILNDIQSPPGYGESWRRVTYSVNEYDQAAYVAENFHLKLAVDITAKNGSLPVVLLSEEPVYINQSKEVTKEVISYDPKDKKKKNPIKTIEKVIVNESVQGGVKNVEKLVSNFGFINN